MQSLPYSALNESQLAQVKYLFADQSFGTNATAFVYEIDKRGAVTGRAMDGGQRTMSQSHKAKVLHVTAQEEVSDTDEIIFTHSSGALSALLAKKFLTQVEEVNHE